MLPLLISAYHQSGFTLLQPIMLIRLVLEYPLASQHLMARCLLTTDHIPGLELLPVLAKLFVHALAKFLLELVSGQLLIVEQFGWKFSPMGPSCECQVQAGRDSVLSEVIEPLVLLIS